MITKADRMLLNTILITTIGLLLRLPRLTVTVMLLYIWIEASEGISKV